DSAHAEMKRVTIDRHLDHRSLLAPALGPGCSTLNGRARATRTLQSAASLTRVVVGSARHLINDFGFPCYRDGPSQPLAIHASGLEPRLASRSHPRSSLEKPSCYHFRVLDPSSAQILTQGRSSTLSPS